MSYESYGINLHVPCNSCMEVTNRARCARICTQYAESDTCFVTQGHPFESRSTFETQEKGLQPQESVTSQIRYNVILPSSYGLTIALLSQVRGSLGASKKGTYW